MKILGVQLTKPSFAMLTRATGVAVVVWVAVLFGTRQFGLPLEPLPALASILIGALLFIAGIDVFKDSRHLIVGLGGYIVLNMAVETLVLPLI